MQSLTDHRNVYIYCETTEAQHDYINGRCAHCSQECDHSGFDAIIDDLSFDYLGTHTTNGRSGHQVSYGAYCSNCGTTVPLPDWND